MDRHLPRNPFEADDYARLTGFDGKWRETWWRKDFISFIVERHQLGGAKTLLDVGCGAGHWGRTLSSALSADTLIAGIDIESNFVERSKELGAAFGLSKMDYRVGSAEAIPHGDHSFDVVTCQTVLIHVHDAVACLREMKRVLKPGGVLLLAEPNNLTGYFNSLLADPRPEWSVIQQLTDFYRTCLEGKKALKMGDSSIGERLPALVTEAGFSDLLVSVNENTPSLVSPYSTETEQVNRDALVSTLKTGAWTGFGPEANARRFHEAAGGKPADFARLWSLTMDYQSKILDAIQSGNYSGGRGPMMYLISARA